MDDSPDIAYPSLTRHGASRAPAQQRFFENRQDLRPKRRSQIRWISDELYNRDCGNNSLGKYKGANAHVHLLMRLSTTKGYMRVKRKNARMIPHRSRTWLACGETQGSQLRGSRAPSRASYARGRCSARTNALSRAPRLTPHSVGRACRGGNPTRGAMVHGKRQCLHKVEVCQTGVAGERNK